MDLMTGEEGFVGRFKTAVVLRDVVIGRGGRCVCDEVEVEDDGLLGETDVEAVGLAGRGCCKVIGTGASGFGGSEREGADEAEADFDVVGGGRGGKEGERVLTRFTGIERP